MDQRNASSPLLGKADSYRTNGNSVSCKSGKSGESHKSGRTGELSFGKSVDGAADNGAAFNGADVNGCIVDAFPCVGVAGSRGRDETGEEEEQEEDEEEEAENKPVGSRCKEPI